jgi:hypothetical protein
MYKLPELQSAFVNKKEKINECHFYPSRFFKWKYILTRTGQAKKQISVKAFNNYAECRWQQE